MQATLCGAAPDPASAAFAAAGVRRGECVGSRPRVTPTEGRILVTTTLLHLDADLSGAVRNLVASAVHEPRSERETAAALVALAREHLPYDHASILLRERDGSLRTAAYNAPELEHVESAAELGLRGVVTFRLVEDMRACGVLSLYTTSERPTTDGLDIARQFADSASVALRVTGEVWNLHQALAHRAVIGQALGLLMGKYDLDQDQALSEMKRVSSDSDRTLHAVASDILATRQLAAAPGSTRRRG